MAPLWSPEHLPPGTLHSRLRLSPSRKGPIPTSPSTWRPRSSTINGFWGGTVKEPSNILELNQGVKKIFPNLFSEHFFTIKYYISLIIKDWKDTLVFLKFYKDGFLEERFCFERSMNQNRAKIVNKSDHWINLFLSCAYKTMDIP